MVKHAEFVEFLSKGFVLGGYRVYERCIRYFYNKKSKLRGVVESVIRNNLANGGKSAVRAAWLLVEDAESNRWDELEIVEETDDVVAALVENAVKWKLFGVLNWILGLDGGRLYWEVVKGIKECEVDVYGRGSVFVAAWLSGEKRATECTKQILASDMGFGAGALRKLVESGCSWQRVLEECGCVGASEWTAEEARRVREYVLEVETTPGLVEGVVIGMGIGDDLMDKIEEAVKGERWKALIPHSKGLFRSIGSRVMDSEAVEMRRFAIREVDNASYVPERVRKALFPEEGFGGSVQILAGTAGERFWNMKDVVGVVSSFVGPPPYADLLLNLAIASKDKVAARVLLDRGTSVSGGFRDDEAVDGGKTGCGNRPLVVAAWLKNRWACERLLRRGASVNVGGTSFNYSRKSMSIFAQTSSSLIPLLAKAGLDLSNPIHDDAVSAGVGDENRSRALLELGFKLGKGGFSRWRSYYFQSGSEEDEEFFIKTLHQRQAEEREMLVEGIAEDGGKIAFRNGFDGKLLRFLTEEPFALKPAPWWLEKAVESIVAREKDTRSTALLDEVLRLGDLAHDYKLGAKAVVKAVSFQRVDLVHYLLERGADPNEALEVAQEKFPEVVPLLLGGEVSQQGFGGAVSRALSLVSEELAMAVLEGKRGKDLGRIWRSLPNKSSVDRTLLALVDRIGDRSIPDFLDESKIVVTVQTMALAISRGMHEVVKVLAPFVQISAEHNHRHLEIAVEKCPLENLELVIYALKPLHCGRLRSICLSRIAQHEYSNKDCPRVTLTKPLVEMLMEGGAYPGTSFDHRETFRTVSITIAYMAVVLKKHDVLGCLLRRPNDCNLEAGRREAHDYLATSTLAAAISIDDLDSFKLLKPHYERVPSVSNRTSPRIAAFLQPTTKKATKKKKKAKKSDSI